MLKDPVKLAELAEKTWCDQGERLLFRIGPRGGHEAYQLGEHRGAPYDGSRRFPPRSDTVPEWPLPTEPVAEGRFHGDEWVDDPAIWAFLHAPHPDAVAVRCADGLGAGRAESWLVLSNRRLAVVLAESTTAEPPGEQDADQGGWWARATGWANAARSLVDQVGSDDADRLHTLWEVPSDAVLGCEAVALGRWGLPTWFGRIAFRDGSALLVRMAHKAEAESVAKASAELTG